MRPKDPFWDVTRLVVTSVVVLVSLAALIEALGFQRLAGYFPIASAGMVVVFGLGQLIRDVINYRAGRAVVIVGMDVESPLHGLGAAGLRVALRYTAWFVGYVALFYVTGGLVSSLVFVTAFLKLEAQWTWPGSLGLALGVTTVSGLMVRLLDLDLPRTLLDLGHDLVL